MGSGRPDSSASVVVERPSRPFTCTAADLIWGVEGLLGSDSTYACCQEWAEVQGTKLRCIASHFVKNLLRTPHARTAATHLFSAGSSDVLNLLQDAGNRGSETPVVPGQWHADT